MKHIGLFEGIGGFSLAARWMGWETVAWCEWNLFCQKILKQHFPDAEGFGDITKTNFTKYANKIDIVTGGFPCQPYSVAGKRKGKEDDRHLWPEMLRAIREIQPTYVVGENVSGLVSWSGGLVFHEVQTDLETEGYEVFPFILPACAKNAPHRRDRIWFIAHSNRSGINTTEGATKSIWEQQNKEQPGSRGSMQINGLSNERVTSDTSSQSGQQKIDGREIVGQEWEQIRGITPSTNESESTANPASGGLQRGLQDGQAIGIKAFDYEGNWQPLSEPSIFRGDDGVSNRMDRTKALGNSIVPQIAYEIFRSIVEIKNVQPGDGMKCGVGKKIA